MRENIESLKDRKVDEFEVWMDVQPGEVNILPNSLTEQEFGVDLGSTYTRIRRCDSEEMEYGDCHQMNSDIVLVNDLSNIKSKTSSVYSNLEFIIKDVTESAIKPKKIFDEKHFVKGDLAFGMSEGRLSRSSQISKTQLLPSYLNMLSAIAIDILVNNDNGSTYTSHYKVIPSITLPPEDFKSVKVLSEFKKNLAGTYTVEFVRLGVEFIILIDESSVYLDKEPNAVQYSLASIDDSLLTKTTVVVDGGGKSTDISVMLNGVILDKYSRTLPVGGNKLCMDIIDEYTLNTGKTEPPLRSIEEALANGVLVRGGVETDIKNEIVTCKRQMSETIFNGIMAVLDRAGISPDDVDALTFHGRLFTTTVFRDETECNMKDICLDKFLEITEVDCNHVVDTDCTTEGVIISRWVEESK